MHIWKMSKMEVANNPILCLFIMMQSVVVLVAILFGVSIYTSRYDKYEAIHDIMGDSGYILNAQHLMQAGENEGNLICGETEEVQALFPGADVTCTYSVWTVYDYKDIWEQYEPDTIAYDNDVAFCYTPTMAEGRWLSSSDNNTVEIEAVITNNEFGIGLGDEFYITTNSLGEPLEEKLTVKVIGIVEDNSYILGTPDKYMDRYEDVRDCFFTYSPEFNTRPFVFFLQDDLRSTEEEVLGAPCITTMVMGNQFISFSGDLTKEEVSDLESVIFSNKCELIYYMEMGDVTKESMDYIWAQIKEILPIFIGLLVFVIMSVTCTSAMITRTQLKNYAIYYVLGLKWKDCIKIQVLQQVLLQCVTFVITLAGFGILIKRGVLDDTLFEMGVEQFLACLMYVVICMCASAILPIKIINNNSPKHILTSRI